MSIHDSSIGVISIREGSALNAGKADKYPTSPTEKQTGSTKFAPWGSNNKFPLEVMESISDVTLAKPILDWKSRALYGGGIAYGILSVKDGKEKFIRLFDSEIEEFFDRTDIMEYATSASVNFYHFYNIFPELIQTRDGKKINYLTNKDSVACRWKKRETEGKQKGLITKCYIKYDWLNPSLEHADEVDVIQTFRDPFKQVRATKNKNWIYPVNYTTPGKSYYMDAPWHVIIDNWLTIAREVPAFKKNLLKNQASIKYLITVPEWWWKWKYPEWDKKNDKERREIISQEHKAFDDFFSGSSNTGKSLMVTERDDDHAKKYKSWKIEYVDDKLKEGVYIEDSQEADQHIFKNMNVNPTLFGGAAGKGSESGSGSDARVAWNTYMNQTKPHQDLILKPLHFIGRYNGWENRLLKKEGLEGQGKLVFWFKNYLISTLNSGSETKPQ